VTVTATGKFAVALVVVCLAAVSLVATFSRSSNLFTRVVALSRRGRKPWTSLNPAIGLSGGNLRFPGRHSRRHIGFSKTRTDGHGRGGDQAATPVVRQFAGVDDPAPEAAVATEGHVQQHASLRRPASTSTLIGSSVERPDSPRVDILGDANRLVVALAQGTVGQRAINYVMRVTAGRALARRLEACRP